MLTLHVLIDMIRLEKYLKSSSELPSKIPFVHMFLNI